MKDEDKTKDQLITELVELRQSITELKESEAAQKQANEVLENSERLYRTTINSLAKRLYVVDTDLRLILLNTPLKQWCKELGLETDMIGRKPFEVFPFLSDKVRSEYQQVIDSGKKLITEESIQIQGRKIFIEIHKIPVFDEDRVDRVITVLSDITKHKEAEKALLESEIRLSQIVDGSSIPTFVINKKHLITHWNRACENLTGIFANEMIGRDKQWLSFYSTKRPVLADLIVDEMPEEEIDRYYSGRYRKSSVKKGAYEAVDFFSDLSENGKWLFFTAAPLRDVDGKITEAIETLQDVSEFMQTKEALSKAYDELEQRVRERTAELTAANSKLRQEIIERKKAQQTLHERTETLNAIVAASPIGIGLVKDRVIDWASEAMYNILGYKKDSLEGKNTSDVYRDDKEYERVGRELYSGIGKSGSAYVDTQWVRKDGTIIDCELRARFIDPLDPSKGAIVAAMDITERKEAEKKLQQSEKMFRSLVETMNDGLLVQNKSGSISYINDKLSKMLGYSRDEIIKHEITYFFDEANLHILEEQIGKRKKGKDEPYEITWTGKDEKNITTIMSPKGIFDIDGQFKGSFVVITDITDRKKTEDALRNSEQRFRDISHSMADYIWEVDKNVRFTYVSGKVKQILGYDPEEMIGKTPFDLLPKEEAERAEEFFKKIFSEKKQIINFENWIFTKEGDQVCLRTNGVPILDGKGEILGYRGVDKDITLKKQAEKKLKQTLKELERSNTELEQFAYVASHDLQEPLRKIQAFGDRLKTKCGNALNDRGSDYLRRMQNAAKRMQILINDLLTFSRVSTRTQPFSQVNLSNVVQKTLSNLETFIEQTEGCVEVGNLPTIDADMTQMHQLLQNLISNALKFHRKKEAPFVKIHGQLIKRQEQQPAGVLPADEYCQIVVEDNGIGFDEKYLDRIFGVFQRLHGRGVYEGTGIGLANCRKIVERHGGSITAKSTPGKGATFIVTLPVKQTKEGKAQ